MLSTGLSLIKSAYSRGLAYVRDGLKLYMPYRGSDHSEVKFVGTGSTNFDGTNDYVSVADAANLSFGDGSDDSAFSISAWIKMDDTASFEIIGKGEYNVDAEWRFRTESDSKLHFTLYDEDVSSTFENAYTDVALTAYEGKWVHVVGTYNGIGGEDVAKTGITLYVNGVVAASTQTSGGTYVSMVNGTSPVEIGLYAASVYAEGNMKNIAIWSRELTATEVQNVMYKTYDEVGGRLASGLVSWWALDATGLGEERINDPDFSLTGTKLTGNYATPQGIYWETEWDLSYADHATTDADNGWAISGGAATLNDSHTTGYDLVNSTGGANDNSVVFVTSYQVTFEVTDVNGGAVAPMIGGTIGTTRSTVGTYTETIITANTDAFRMRSVGTWSGSITVKNISAKLVAAVDLESSNDGTILGPIVDTDLYGGDTPVKPRAIDNAPTVQADPIGAGSASFVAASSNYIDCGTAIGTALGNNYDLGLTATLWFKADITSGVDDGLFNIGLHAGANGDFSINLNSDTIIVKCADTTSSSTAFTDITSWHHVAAVFDGANNMQYLYLDGVLKDDTVSAGTLDLHANKTIIGSYYNVGFGMDGNICQVGIWDEALTQAQVQSVMEKTYNELNADDRTNLVSYWPLDEADNNSVVDKVDETLGTALYEDNMVSNTNLGDWSGDDCNITFDTDHFVVTETDVSQSAALLDSLAPTAGKVYKISVDIKSGTFSGTMTLGMHSTWGSGSGEVTAAPNSSSFTTFTFYSMIIAGDDTFNMYTTMGSGETYFFKNLSIKPVNGNAGILT